MNSTRKILLDNEKFHDIVDGCKEEINRAEVQYDLSYFLKNRMEVNLNDFEIMEYPDTPNYIF